MFQLIISSFLILVSLGIFVTYTDSTYQDIELLEQEIQKYDDVLLKAQELQTLRDNLAVVYNSYSTENLQKLSKMVPTDIDNVRFIIEVESIASSSDMVLGEVQVNGAPRNTGVQTGIELDRVSLQIEVRGTYKNFLNFISNLEKSLRIVEITDLTFSSDDIEDSDDELDFTLELDTFWLSEPESPNPPQ